MGGSATRAACSRELWRVYCGGYEPAKLAMFGMAEPIPLRAPPAAGVRPGPRPRVSVLIPAYNAAATIAEALDSALVQSPPPYEVVVSDDGSRDNLAAALQPFRDHIRVVHGPNG